MGALHEVLYQLWPLRSVASPSLVPAGFDFFSVMLQPRQLGLRSIWPCLCVTCYITSHSGWGKRFQWSISSSWGERYEPLNLLTSERLQVEELLSKTLILWKPYNTGRHYRALLYFKFSYNKPCKNCSLLAFLLTCPLCCSGFEALFFLPCVI